MCLLHLLRSRDDLRVVAAHYEHGLRGEESLRDAEFVRSFCTEQGIPCVVEHGDVPGYAKGKGIGLEAAARELRYAFLERTADALGCDWIATAHNADDNAETLLLNLLRGTGTAGLRGIPPRRGRIVRPLLAFSREEIAAYLTEHGLPHVEDSSNQSETYTRNRLRLQVLPVLREMNPRFLDAAGRTAALLREDEDCLDGQAEDFLQAHLDGKSLPIAPLCALHPAVASRVLRKLGPRSLERAHVEQALAFCTGSGLGFLNLPGLRLRREQGRLFWDGDSPVSLPCRVVIPGETLPIPEAGMKLRAEWADYQGEIYDLFKTYLFKCETLCGTLYCTGRRPGDRLHPQGRACGKSLHDLFREAGLTQRERDRLPVLRDEQGVLAVWGFPADERVRPEPGDRVLRITFENNIGGQDGESH